MFPTTEIPEGEFRVRDKSRGGYIKTYLWPRQEAKSEERRAKARIGTRDGREKRAPKGEEEVEV